MQAAESIATGFGYPFEEHFVTTSDGYILRLYRIPYGRHDEPPASPSPPFLFVNAVAGNSITWMIRGPDLSPAFYFANRGYDVWMLNSRGSLFSRNHTTLDPDSDHEFWDFNMVGLADDLRPCYEYILGLTGYQNLVHIGATFGATHSLIAFANDPYFQEHVSAVILCATMGEMRDLRTGLLMPVFQNPLILPTLRNLGMYEFGAFNPLGSYLPATM